MFREGLGEDRDLRGPLIPSKGDFEGVDTRESYFTSTL